METDGLPEKGNNLFPAKNKRFVMNFLGVYSGMAKDLGLIKIFC